MSSHSDSGGATRRRILGAAGGTVAALAAAQPAAGQAGTTTGGSSADVKPDFGGYVEGVDGGYRDARGESEVTVMVGASGNGGAYAFAPAGLWVDPGTTITWKWTGDGGGHTVTAESGAFDSGNHSEAGYTFEQTFDEGGVVDYYCTPHKSLGMKGAVAVGEDVPTVPIESGGSGGKPRPLPGGDTGSAVALFAFGAVGVAAALVLGAEGYAELREHGGVRGPRPETVGGAVEEAPAQTAERELHHDEFDPVGTASLIAVYFAILVLMWVFMYFVEFLGNGPTVVG